MKGRINATSIDRFEAETFFVFIFDSLFFFSTASSNIFQELHSGRFSGDDRSGNDFRPLRQRPQNLERILDRDSGVDVLRNGVTGNSDRAAQNVGVDFFGDLVVVVEDADGRAEQQRRLGPDHPARLAPASLRCRRRWR